MITFPSGDQAGILSYGPPVSCRNSEPPHADPHGEVLLVLRAELEAQHLVEEVGIARLLLGRLLEERRALSPTRCKRRRSHCVASRSSWGVVMRHLHGQAHPPPR